MKKLLLMVAFCAVSYAAQAQCSKHCSASSPDCKKSSASVSTSSNGQTVATANADATTGKTAVGNKKRRKARVSGK